MNNPSESEFKRLEILANLHIKVIMMASIGIAAIGAYLSGRIAIVEDVDIKDILQNIFMYIEMILVCSVIVHWYRLRKIMKKIGEEDEIPC